MNILRVSGELFLWDTSYLKLTQSSQMYFLFCYFDISTVVHLKALEEENSGKNQSHVICVITMGVDCPIHKFIDAVSPLNIILKYYKNFHSFLILMFICILTFTNYLHLN